MRWPPWKTAKTAAAAQEHREEIAEVEGRLDVVEERVDDLDDQIAVLQRDGGDA